MTSLMLSVDQAAQRAGISRRTLDRLLSLGEGPTTYRVSIRRLGIREADLEVWLSSRRRLAPATDVGAPLRCQRA